ncbi:MAG TPA: alcohol dehydrogenase catalytic domain-containing protein [Micromonosporaceae bacterium]|nr:alcohol dehydrogenase catalytic domain-containing protein [Micromonosporaceae bacterium]
MRAARYVSAREFAVSAGEEVPPGPGEVRVDVAYTGICGTDLHIFHGDMDARVQAPMVIGHEMSGTVAALGDGVTDFAVGDQVTAMPLRWCGECPACLAGNQHVCHNLNFVGIDSPGAMQASWTVPASLLIPLPAGLSLEHAALVEPTAVAVHDVRRAELGAGERVLVVGGGPVGLLIACVARHEGADVRLAEVSPQRRALAAELGLVTIDPSTDDAVATVNEWTGGAGADVTFEVSGAGAGVALAIDALRVRGRLVLVAIHPKPREVNLFRFFWRELTLVGARLYDRSDFERAVALIAAGHVPVGALISQVQPMDGVNAAFTALESGGGLMKVLIDCRS